MLTNHGGVCLLYKTTFSALVVQLLVYKTFEVMAVYLHSTGLNLLAIVVYHSGSTAVSCAFFNEFNDILECPATFTSPIVILGDINIYLDVMTDLNTTKFLSSLDGHTLDVLITCSDVRVMMLIVDEPKLSGSDHSFITSELELRQENTPVVKVSECRRWRAFNENSFTDDLVRSKLIIHLPSDVVSLVNCYDQMLKSLVDRHAPLVKVIIRLKPTAP